MYIPISSLPQVATRETTGGNGARAESGQQLSLTILGAADGRRHQRVIHSSFPILSGMELTETVGMVASLYQVIRAVQDTGISMERAPLGTSL